MLARIAVLILSALPLAAQTPNVQDYLPLAVGNSWTYLHTYYDVREREDGSPIYPQGYAEMEFTISILRTEVIDGETYFVVSDLPSNLPTDVPKHFIASKKLRWDGNNLVEHDGTSEVSFYRFSVARDGRNPIKDEYAISETHGDTLIETYSSRKGFRTTNYQIFDFRGHGYIDGWKMSRGMSFIMNYGIDRASEVYTGGDAIYGDNRLRPVRAVLSTSGGASSGQPRSSSSVAVSWDDFTCYMSAHDTRYDDTCNYPPASTSKSPPSWGSVKDERR